MSEVLPGLLLLAVGAVVYLFPVIVAKSRKKKDTGAIFALNLLLGWTVIGWIGALVWSLVTDKA